MGSYANDDGVGLLCCYTFCFLLLKSHSFRLSLSLGVKKWTSLNSTTSNAFVCAFTHFFCKCSHIFFIESFRWFPLNTVLRFFFIFPIATVIWTIRATLIQSILVFSRNFMLILVSSTQKNHFDSSSVDAYVVFYFFLLFSSFNRCFVRGIFYKQKSMQIVERFALACVHCSCYSPIRKMPPKHLSDNLLAMRGCAPFVCICILCCVYMFSCDRRVFWSSKQTMPNKISKYNYSNEYFIVYYYRCGDSSNISR